MEALSDADRMAALEKDNRVLVRALDAANARADRWKGRYDALVDKQKTLQNFWTRWFGIGWPENEDINSLERDLHALAFPKESDGSQ